MPYLWHIDPADVRESIKVGTVVYVRVETNLVVHMSNAHSISALKVTDDKLPETWTDIKSIEAILWLNKSIGIENHYIASGHQTYIPSRSKNPLKLLAESPVRQ